MHELWQPLERFTIEAEVARGGVGVVYRARDETTGHPVALKVVAAEAGVAQREEERLLHEGQLLSQLDHPTIVKVIAVGRTPRGQPFVAMEWLDGRNLAERQRRVQLAPREGLSLLASIADGLEHVHQLGNVHRDVKPANIIIVDEQTLAAKLVDFGVATWETTAEPSEILGTPAYMAPEQVRSDTRVDHRADIYAIGATLFELLSGRTPHLGPNRVATLARLVTTPAPRLRDVNPAIPTPVDAFVARMLALDPSQRPGSCREVSEQLTEFSETFQDLEFEHPTALSSRLGSGATRLITSIVALSLDSVEKRENALRQAARRGAVSVPFGSDAVVIHLGTERTVGSEAIAALDLGSSLARLDAKVGIASGRARITLGSGNAVQPVGEVVDRAAALAREAANRAVVVDATTCELGRGHYQFKTRRDGAAKVIERVRSQTLEISSRGGPFVGREQELAQLMSGLDRAMTGTPILATVNGPPGIGKSRLRRELMARLVTRKHTLTIVSQRSEAYAKAHPLSAVAGVLRALLHLPKGASIAQCEAAIVECLGPETRREVTNRYRDAIAQLLASEPLADEQSMRAARDLIWLAMTDLLLQVTTQEPILIALEDLQWADPESIAFFDHLLGRANRKPLFVLATVRPEFWSHYPERFAERDHIRLNLKPISKRAAATLAQALLGDASTTTAVEHIVKQSAGLPLFAEELARLVASGQNAADTPTIEAAIQAHLDSLGEAERDAIGRLSVFGQTLWDEGLRALGFDEPEKMLRVLGDAEVILEQETSKFDETREWIFKHAFVRDVAYRALGTEQRQQLHALAGQWLATVGEDAAVVAGHFDRGGEPQRASRYWARAARRALTANALTDAQQMAERALSHATTKQEGFSRALLLDEAFARLDPRASDRMSAITALEENIHDVKTRILAEGAKVRFDEVRGVPGSINQRLESVRDRAAALGIHDEMARCCAVLAMRHAFAGDFEAAGKEASRLLELARTQGLLWVAVDAWQALAITRQTQGALSAALEARRNAAKAARAADLREREAILTTNLGFALTTVGARQESRSLLESGLLLADAVGSAGAIRHAKMILLCWTATFGQDKSLDGVLADVRAEADSVAGAAWAALDRENLGVIFYRGCELLSSPQQAQREAARSLLKMSADNYRITENNDVLPVALGIWAMAEHQLGNVELALELATEAANLLEAGAPSLLNESAVYVALYDCYRTLGDDARAQRAIERGLQPLQRRIRGLMGTSYAQPFLTELPHNAALVSAAEGFGLVPDSVQFVLERGTL